MAISLTEADSLRECFNRQVDHRQDTKPIVNASYLTAAGTARAVTLMASY
jgi:hypothetical protein